MSQSMTKKFLFDTAFDTDDQFQHGARSTLTYSQQQLLAARAEAFAEGSIAGREEAQHGAEQVAARALKAIDAKLGAFVLSQLDHSEAVARQALEVAIAIARKCAPATAEGEGEADDQDTVLKSATELSAIYDIPVQLSAVLGKSSMQVSQLLKLGRGAVVELDRRVGEAIDIYVNNRLWRAAKSSSSTSDWA